MIVVTGTAGFIGSCMLGKLNNEGIRDVIIVDDFSREEKKGNFERKGFVEKINRDAFISWLDIHHKQVDFIFHIGARTDTAEFDENVFNRLNVNYSKAIWNACSSYGIPLIYASSAATYGLGELGYTDSHDIVNQLRPLNPYGVSKNEFDKWVLEQKQQPPYWYGLKFFNVYGPNEYHKGRMASVIIHAFNQIKKTGKVKLFRSHHPDFADGKQLRDFVYVKDVTEVMYFLMNYKKNSGLYNLGTGKARTFSDLATNTFHAMDLDPSIEFIDTPIDIRDKYQYFTEANMDKLKHIGYVNDFYTLEEGINDYVRNYLIKKAYF